MKFFLTGGTGFVGTALTKHLLENGHTVTILSRRPPKQAGTSAVQIIQGDPTKPGPWQQQVPEHDVVINLAGASIFVRWTPENKRIIRESRVLTTQNVVAALAGAKDRQTHLFLSTSAIGYYGDRGDEELTEDSPPGNDFLAKVAQEWEAAALTAQDLGVRTLVTRFGIVLGAGGGLLGSMVPLFKSFVGGPVGSGRQWLSWIDQTDQWRAFLFVMEHPDLSGVINFTAPNPVRNSEFAKELAKLLNRPSFMPAPALLVKLVLGEFAEVILGGQRVLPKRLLAAGFTFEYPTIAAALRHQLVEGGK